MTRGRATRALHARESGQIVVIMALLAIALFGIAALAIDGGIAAADRRDLQSYTDLSGLAGVQEYSNGGSSTDAHYVAILYMQRSLHASALPAGCSSTACPAGAYTFGNGYAVTVSDPGGQSLDVSASHSRPTVLAGILGFVTSTDASSGRAEPVQNGGLFGYALYSQTTVSSGNQLEQVTGDTYVGTQLNPQAHGHAGFCADFYPAGSHRQGHIVFGGPQSISAGVMYSTGCAGNGGHGEISAAAPSGDCSVASGSPGWQSSVNECVATAFTPPPVLVAPTITATVSSCTVSSALPPGVYDVPPSVCPTFTVDFGGSGYTMPCVSFVVEPGVASFTINGKGGTTQWTSYGDTAAGCPGAANDRSIIYQPINGNSQQTTLTAQGPGCCPEYDLTGAIYLPSGLATTSTNAAFNIDGQAIVYQWNVQSGNHVNPDVTYDPSQLPAISLGGGLTR